MNIVGIYSPGIEQCWSGLAKWWNRELHRDYVRHFQDRGFKGFHLLSGEVGGFFAGLSRCFQFGQLSSNRLQSLIGVVRGGW